MKGLEKYRRGLAAAAVAWLGLSVVAAPASAQSVALDNDKIMFLSPAGLPVGFLSAAELELGGSSSLAGELVVNSAVGLNVFAAFGDTEAVVVRGSFTIWDPPLLRVLEVDPDNSITSVTDELYVRRSSGVSTARIDGAGGNLSLGGDGQDGDLTLKDNDFNDTIRLDGDSGNARTSLDGNGFVKGWARIAADGTVLSCYNCDADPAKTYLNDNSPMPGQFYLVDFSPIAADISSRPRVAQIDRLGTAVAPNTTWGIVLADDDSDPSRIGVVVARQDTGTTVLSPFTLIVY